MSRATEILLSVDKLDAPQVEDLSFWLASGAPRDDDRTEASPGHLLPLTESVGEDWGGSKLTSSTIWAGVTNHVDFDQFLDRVSHMPWDEPDRVQLIVRDDGDPWFRLYMVRDGELRQYAPAPPEEDQDRRW